MFKEVYAVVSSSSHAALLAVIYVHPYSINVIAEFRVLLRQHSEHQISSSGGIVHLRSGVPEMTKTTWSLAFDKRSHMIQHCIPMVPFLDGAGYDGLRNQREIRLSRLLLSPIETRRQRFGALIFV